MARRLVSYALLGTAAVLAAVLVFPEPAYSHKPITTTVLFKNEIAQIFQRKCFQCHSDNNLSMSLTNYTAARPWARAIREEILDREMPPWSAVRGYGDFANDLSLNQREMEIILSWADGGAPSGVLKVDEGTNPVYVPSGPSWEHGAPDVVLPVSGGHAVAAGAPPSIQRFVVATNLPASRALRGIALKQGDRRVVRSAAFFEEASGRWLGGWTPWQTLFQLPGGAAVRLPARARVVVEIVYAGVEEAVTDKSELGLYFAAGNGDEVKQLAIAAPESVVEAGATGHRVRSESTVAQSTSGFALWLDAGRQARSIEISAIAPDGLVTPMLWVQDYDPDWRTPYIFASPVALARGTRILMTTYFDNDTPEALKVRPTAKLLTTAAAASSR
jgi:hypothetical protein